MKVSRFALAAALLVAAGVTIGAADWPQWQGPDRTGISKETGLLKTWPANGPPVVWSAGGFGNGYGSPAVAAERIYVQGTRGGSSVVVALNRADGKEVWSKALGQLGNDDRGPGPRSTPTVDGDRVYVLTENGDLACLQTDGAVVWQRNLLKDFSGRQLQWLISESPLVDGAHVIVSPGGPGAGMVKLDKLTGKTVWAAKELSDAAGYSSPIAADIQGVRTYLTFTSGAGVGVRASDGKLMFSYTKAANRTANITTPVFFDNKVFFTSGYDTGGGLIALKAENGSVSASELYFTREMKNHHGGVVLVNGYLYGFNESILTCLEFATGKQMWRDRSVGKGSIAFADGNLYLLGENNVVGIAEASPEGYREKGRFQIADKGLPSWAHPVISGGRLYVRNQDTLMAYDIKAK
ncbi:MAG: PQQ-binding-like beta-propeller repeat protein [Vicinamibacterales bacterium]